MKDKLKNFKHLFFKILKFEIFYRFAIFLIISPLINKILQIYLNNNSSGAAFNQYILFNFLNLEGITVVLIIMMMAVIAIGYEFSVLINMITLNKQNKDFRIYEVMKTSLLNLSCLKHPSSILTGIFFLFILPLVHLGYINSLIPSLKIPNFIFGELSLTFQGNILICLIYGLYFGIYGLMFFVPVLMILKKENIIKAFKENIKFHKLLTLKERISLIGIMGIWIVLENGLIQILPDALIKNADFNRYFLKNLIISSRFRIYLLEYIIYTLIIMVLMIVFYQYLIGVMGKHEPELLKVKVDLEFNRLFDRTLLKAQIHGNRFFQSLDKYFFETHFYQKYRGMINLVFWPCMFILITYLFPNSIYILSAILIVVLLMYFAASIIIRYEKRKNGQEFEDDSGLLFLPYRLIKRTLNNSRLYNHHPRMVTALLAFISVCLVGMYLEQPLMLHHPWVIGHRGSIYGVENTDGAIMTAADKGADYAEIDVQLSKDGVPVVIHDADLSRLAHKDEKVKNMTAKQLSETLVYHNEYTDKIPTLDHLIKKLKKNSTKMGLLIELKVEGGNGEKLAKKIIDVIEKNDYQKQAIYMSLDLDTVQYLQSQRPEWWIGYCIYGSAGDIEGSLWNQGIDFLAIEENRATVSFVEKANRNWVPVYVWTVDDESRMMQYLELGVSGIITNYPNRGRKAVDKFKENNYQYYYHHGSGYPDS